MIYSNGTAPTENVYNDEEDQDDLLRAEEQFAEDMQAGLSDDAPWKRIQQNTFTRWANEHLKVVNRQINDLQYDLSDGLLLIALIEILSQKKLPKHNKKTTFRSQKLENVSVALDFLENVEQIKLVNIDASHIVDGRLKLILGLIWTLILHYYISLPRWESMPMEEQKPGREPTPKQKLMGWVRNMLPPDLPITNFTTDWNDGRAIGALVDACAPGLYPDWVDNDPKNALKNTREAMDLAKDWLGIPQLIRPEEMIDPNVDDRSMMTYLSQYPSAKLKPGAPLRPKTNAALARCYGKGIEPVGNFAGEPTEFFVETKQAGVGKLHVILLNPRGQQEKCDIAFQNDPNRTYRCQYTASTEGQYKVIVKYANEEVPGSPFSPFMDRHPANVNACRAYGPGLESEVTVDKPTWFEVDHSQAGKGRVESVIVDPNNQEVPVVIKPVDSGKSRGEYVPRVQGPHAINILYDGQPIPGSPFSTEAVPDPDACRAYGRGVEPTGVNVGENADFKVVTTGKGDGVVRTAVTGPDGYDVPCSMVRTSPQSYDCSYVPRQAGPHRVNVTYDGRHIPQSPFNVMVAPSRAADVKAYGPGLKGGVVGQPAEFVAETTGSPEDLSFSVEGPDKVKLTCEDRGNGVVGVCYYPTTPGPHAIHVLNNAEEIPGSPFNAWIEPKGAAHASKVQPVKPSDSSRVHVYGPGVEPGVKVNTPTYFIVDCKEAGPGDVSVALTDPLGRDLPLHIEDLDGAFSVGYTPQTAGPHTVTVLFGNTEIAGSPIKVDVEPGIDVSKIYPEEFNPNPVVNRPNQIKMNTMRAGPVNPDLVSAKVTPAFPTAPLPISSEVVPTNTGFGINYQVPKPGPYTISPIVHGVPLEALNVEAVEPVDPSKVRVYGPGLVEGTVNQPSDFTIDMGGAGPGELRVAVEGPAKPKLTREDNNDESCRVTYVPAAPGDHLISVLFDDQHVPGSPFRPVVLPAKDARQVRAYGPGIDPTAGVSVGCQTEFTVDARPISSLGGDDVQCTLHSLQGPPYKAAVIDNRNGTYTVRYTPEHKGPLDIDVKYEGTPIPGSPFHMNVADALEPGRIRCYGPGLESATINQPAQFTIDTTDAGPGHLDVAIDGPGDAPLVMKQKVDGLCVIEYVPTRPGQYEISIMFNGKPIPSCPYIVPVVDRPSAGQVRVILPEQPLRVNVPSEVIIDGQAASSGVPSVNVVDPYGISRPIPVRTVGIEANFPVAGRPRGSLSSPTGAKYVAELTPATPGVHQVNVEWSGRPVPGSPFNIKVLPRFEPDKVIASGPGIRPTVPASLPTEFTVDAKAAGQGQLDVLIRTPDNSYLDRAIDDNKDGTYTIHYLPVDPGSYNISVSYDSLPILNSPFTISVIPTGDPTKCRISGNGILAQVPVGEQCIIHVDATEAGPGAVTATIMNQAGIPIDFDIIDTKIGTFDIVYVPPMPGQYTIKIRFGGQDIPNGTFVVRAGDDQSKLMASVGQSKPLDFRLPVGGAIGDVTAVMRTPSGKRTTPLIEDNQDGTVSIKYHPTEVGEHELSVFYQGVPVQGSPYKFTVDRVTDGYVTAYGPGLSFGISGEPCHFKVVTKDAGAGSLAVAVEGPSKAEIRCKDNKDGTCDATYWPTAPGDYVITIKYGGKHIAGSPFHAKIVDQPYTDVSGRPYGQKAVPLGDDNLAEVDVESGYYDKENVGPEHPLYSRFDGQPVLYPSLSNDRFGIGPDDETITTDGIPISVVYVPIDSHGGRAPREPADRLASVRAPNGYTEDKPSVAYGSSPHKFSDDTSDGEPFGVHRRPMDSYVLGAYGDRYIPQESLRKPLEAQGPEYDQSYSREEGGPYYRPENEYEQYGKTFGPGKSIASVDGRVPSDQYSPRISSEGYASEDGCVPVTHNADEFSPEEPTQGRAPRSKYNGEFVPIEEPSGTMDRVPNDSDAYNRVESQGHPKGSDDRFPSESRRPYDEPLDGKLDGIRDRIPGRADFAQEPPGDSEVVPIQNFNPIRKLSNATDVPINGALYRYAQAAMGFSSRTLIPTGNRPHDQVDVEYDGTPSSGAVSEAREKPLEFEREPSGKTYAGRDLEGRAGYDIPSAIIQDSSIKPYHVDEAGSPDGSSFQPTTADVYSTHPPTDISPDSRRTKSRDQQIDESSDILDRPRQFATAPSDRFDSNRPVDDGTSGYGSMPGVDSKGKPLVPGSTREEGAPGGEVAEPDGHGGYSDITTTGGVYTGKTVRVSDIRENVHVSNVHEEITSRENAYMPRGPVDQTSDARARVPEKGTAEPMGVVHDDIDKTDALGTIARPSGIPGEDHFETSRPRPIVPGVIDKTSPGLYSAGVPEEDDHIYSVPGKGARKPDKSGFRGPDGDIPKSKIGGAASPVERVTISGMPGADVRVYGSPASVSRAMDITKKDEIDRKKRPAGIVGETKLDTSDDGFPTSSDFGPSHVDISRSGIPETEPGERIPQSDGHGELIPHKKIKMPGSSPSHDSGQLYPEGAISGGRGAQPRTPLERLQGDGDITGTSVPITYTSGRESPVYNVVAKPTTVGPRTYFPEGDVTDDRLPASRVPGPYYSKDDTIADEHPDSGAPYSKDGITKDRLPVSHELERRSPEGLVTKDGLPVPSVHYFVDSITGNKIPVSGIPGEHFPEDVTTERCPMSTVPRTTGFPGTLAEDGRLVSDVTGTRYPKDGATVDGHRGPGVPEMGYPEDVTADGHPISIVSDGARHPVGGTTEYRVPASVVSGARYPKDSKDELPVLDMPEERYPGGSVGEVERPGSGIPGGRYPEDSMMEDAGPLSGVPEALFPEGIKVDGHPVSGVPSARYSKSGVPVSHVSGGLCPGHSTGKDGFPVSSLSKTGYPGGGVTKDGLPVSSDRGERYHGEVITDGRPLSDEPGAHYPKDTEDRVPESYIPGKYYPKGSVGEDGLPWSSDEGYPQYVTTDEHPMSNVPITCQPKGTEDGGVSGIPGRSYPKDSVGEGGGLPVSHAPGADYQQGDVADNEFPMSITRGTRHLENVTVDGYPTSGIQEIGYPKDVVTVDGRPVASVQGVGYPKDWVTEGGVVGPDVPSTLYPRKVHKTDYLEGDEDRLPMSSDRSPRYPGDVSPDGRPVSGEPGAFEPRDTGDKVPKSEAPGKEHPEDGVAVDGLSASVPSMKRYQEDNVSSEQLMSRFSRTQHYEDHVSPIEIPVSFGSRDGFPRDIATTDRAPYLGTLSERYPEGRLAEDGVPAQFAPWKRYPGDGVSSDKLPASGVAGRRYPKDGITDGDIPVSDAHLSESGTALSGVPGSSGSSKYGVPSTEFPASIVAKGRAPQGDATSGRLLGSSVTEARIPEGVMAAGMPGRRLSDVVKSDKPLIPFGVPGERIPEHDAKTDDRPSVHGTLSPEGEIPAYELPVSGASASRFPVTSYGRPRSPGSYTPSDISARVHPASGVAERRYPEDSVTYDGLPTASDRAHFSKYGVSEEGITRTLHTTDDITEEKFQMSGSRHPKDRFTDHGIPDARGERYPGNGITGRGIPISGIRGKGYPDDGVTEGGIPVSGIRRKGYPDDGLTESGIPVSGIHGKGYPDDSVKEGGIPVSGIRRKGYPDDGVTEGGIPVSGIRRKGYTDDGVTEGGIPVSGIRGKGYPDDGVTGGGIPGSGMRGKGYPDDGVTEGGIPVSAIRGKGYPDYGVTGGGIPVLGIRGKGYPDDGVTEGGIPVPGIREKDYPPEDGITEGGIPVSSIRGKGYPDDGVTEGGIPVSGIRGKGYPDYGVTEGGIPVSGVSSDRDAHFPGTRDGRPDHPGARYPESDAKDTVSSVPLSKDGVEEGGRIVPAASGQPLVEGDSTAPDYSTSHAPLKRVPWQENAPRIDVSDSIKHVPYDTSGSSGVSGVLEPKDSVTGIPGARTPGESTTTGKIPESTLPGRHFPADSISGDVVPSSAVSGRHTPDERAVRTDAPRTRPTEYDSDAVHVPISSDIREKPRYPQEDVTKKEAPVMATRFTDDNVPAGGVLMPRMPHPAADDLKSGDVSGYHGARPHGGGVDADGIPISDSGTHVPVEGVRKTYVPRPQSPVEGTTTDILPSRALYPDDYSTTGHTPSAAKSRFPDKSIVGTSGPTSFPGDDVSGTRPAGAPMPHVPGRVTQDEAPLSEASRTHPLEKPDFLKTTVAPVGSYPADGVIPAGVPSAQATRLPEGPLTGTEMPLYGVPKSQSPIEVVGRPGVRGAPRYVDSGIDLLTSFSADEGDGSTHQYAVCGGPVVSQPLRDDDGSTRRPDLASTRGGSFERPVFDEGIPGEDTGHPRVYAGVLRPGDMPVSLTHGRPAIEGDASRPFDTERSTYPDMPSHPDGRVAQYDRDMSGRPREESIPEDSKRALLHSKLALEPADVTEKELLQSEHLQRQSTHSIDSHTLITTSSKRTIYCENLCDADKAVWLDALPARTGVVRSPSQKQLPYKDGSQPEPSVEIASGYGTPSLSAPGTEPARRISLSFHLPGLPEDDGDEHRVLVHGTVGGYPEKTTGRPGDFQIYHHPDASRQRPGQLGESRHPEIPDSSFKGVFTQEPTGASAEPISAEYTHGPTGPHVTGSSYPEDRTDWKHPEEMVEGPDRHHKMDEFPRDARRSDTDQPGDYPSDHYRRTPVFIDSSGSKPKDTDVRDKPTGYPSITGRRASVPFSSTGTPLGDNKFRSQRPAIQSSLYRRSSVPFVSTDDLPGDTRRTPTKYPHGARGRSSPGRVVSPTSVPSDKRPTGIAIKPGDVVSSYTSSGKSNVIIDSSTSYQRRSIIDDTVSTQSVVVSSDRYPSERQPIGGGRHDGCSPVSAVDRPTVDDSTLDQPSGSYRATRVHTTGDKTRPFDDSISPSRLDGGRLIPGKSDSAIDKDYIHTTKYIQPSRQHTDGLPADRLGHADSLDVLPFAGLSPTYSVPDLRGKDRSKLSRADLMTGPKGVDDHRGLDAEVIPYSDQYDELCAFDGENADSSMEYSAHYETQNVYVDNSISCCERKFCRVSGFNGFPSDKLDDHFKGLSHHAITNGKTTPLTFHAKEPRDVWTRDQTYDSILPDQQERDYGSGSPEWDRVGREERKPTAIKTPTEEYVYSSGSVGPSTGGSRSIPCYDSGSPEWDRTGREERKPTAIKTPTGEYAYSTGDVSPSVVGDHYRPGERTLVYPDRTRFTGSDTGPDGVGISLLGHGPLEDESDKLSKWHIKEYDDRIPRHVADGSGHDLFTSRDIPSDYATDRPIRDADQLTGPVDNFDRKPVVTDRKDRVGDADYDQYQVSSPDRTSPSSRFWKDGFVSSTATDDRSHFVDRRGSVTRTIKQSYEECQTIGRVIENVSFEEEVSSPSTGVARAPYSPDTVGRREVADASRVRVYGAGLDEGYINVANEFVVDSRDAGNGPLAIAIEGPSKANIECPNKDDGTCVVSYKVSEPGTYYVSVKFAEAHVPGSPYTVKVHGPGEPLYRSRVVSDKLSQSVQMQNVSASASRVGSPCELCLRLPGVSSGELTAFVTSPRGRVEDCEVIDVGNQCKSIRFTPKETGIHSVSVKRNGQHIAGSPYQFTVGPIAEGGAQKVHLSGRGLSSGIANVPCEFNVYTREAGSGCLTIQVEGPVNAEINFQEVQDGNGVVSYTCPEPGDYSVTVKFNDQHVPGSPFAVHIEPAMGAISDSASKRITIEDIHMPRGKKHHEINVPLSFNVSTRQAVGSSAKVEAHVISPSGKEEPCTVHQTKEGDKDRYDIRFVPREGGVHRVHVRCNGRELADSPFEFVIGTGSSSSLDSRKVVASGRGLHEGIVGRPCEFFVDTSQAGTGLLAVVVDGPSKVQLDCKESSGGYNVSFVATAVGEYTISIKFAGNTIAGSPYKCHITEFGDVTKSFITSNAEKLASASDRYSDGSYKQSSRSTSGTHFYSQEVSSQHGRYSSGSAGWAIADAGMKTGSDLYSEPQKVRTYGTGIATAKRDEQTEFTVDATEAGHNMLMVGILGPSRPCEEVLVKHIGKNVYNVSYIVREKGSYVLIVKWGDSHIPGSPFYIEVP